MTSPEPQPEDPTETLVRERFESAVGTLQVNVQALVAAGAAAGRHVRSRRRRVQGVAAGVATVLVVASVAIVGNGLPGRRTVPPAGDPTSTVAELLPSNPRALAAAVMAALPGDPRVQEMGGSGSPAKGRLAVDLVFVTRGTQVRLSVRVQRPPSERMTRPCSEIGTIYCGRVRLADGQVARLAANVFIGEGPPNYQVRVLVPGRGITVAESASGGSSLDVLPFERLMLPLSKFELAQIALDPLVGLRTSPRVIARGAALKGFHGPMFCCNR